MVRLAWHSSGTYSVHAKNHGSSGGTIRHSEELGHGANAGLAKLVSMLDTIYSKYKNKISFADLIILSGCVAIREMGGPEVIFRSGRKDKPVSDTPPEGRLPDADKGSMGKTNSHLRDVFGKMGFDDKEIVCLSGAHALGRCHPNASG
jgi:cytochrome c peroxidase